MKNSSFYSFQVLPIPCPCATTWGRHSEEFLRFTKKMAWNVCHFISFCAPPTSVTWSTIPPFFSLSLDLYILWCVGVVALGGWGPICDSSSRCPFSVTEKCRSEKKKTNLVGILSVCTRWLFSGSQYGADGFSFLCRTHFLRFWLREMNVERKIYSPTWDKVANWDNQVFLFKREKKDSWAYSCPKTIFLLMW